MSPHVKLEWTLSESVPVLILKSTVLFPLQVASVQIGMKQNLRLLDDHSDSEDIVAAGVFIDPDGPYRESNLSRFAVASRILSRIRMSHGTTQVVPARPRTSPTEQNRALATVFPGPRAIALRRRMATSRRFKISWNV